MAILSTTNYPNFLLENTFGNQYFKDVVNPAKTGTGAKPPLGQLIKNWNPLKAFSPTMMKTGPTGPGLIGAGITAGMIGGQIGDWAYKNWEPATKFGDWAGGGIYDLLNPKETSIDPTGKNLFTQYYEDDPYAGIEGQTAFLDPVSLYALLKTGTTKKKIGQYLLKNKLQSETGKKIGPKLRRKIRLAQGEKFEGSGIFKNIATGSKDYGPYAKPTTKPYIAPLGPRGEAREQITETAAERKAKIQAAHNAQQRIQQRSLHQGPDTPGGGGRGGPPGGDPGWKGNSGGLVNFYRYGGFI